MIESELLRLCLILIVGLPLVMVALVGIGLFILHIARLFDWTYRG